VRIDTETETQDKTVGQPNSRQLVGAIEGHAMGLVFWIERTVFQRSSETLLKKRVQATASRSSQHARTGDADCFVLVPVCADLAAFDRVEPESPSIAPRDSRTRKGNARSSKVITGTETANGSGRGSELLSGCVV